MARDDLRTAERLRRKMGREARTQSVATRFTKAEEVELLKAAEKQGMTLREWTRGALLREARRPDDDPVFTEVIATRMLLNMTLKKLLLGEHCTDSEYRAVLDEVRTAKRESARVVMAQYRPPVEP